MSNKTKTCHPYPSHKMDEYWSAAGFLLLLPPPPSPPSITALKSVYGETLSEVLKEAAAASSDTPEPSILDIALAVPHLVGQEATPRASLHQSTQSILAAVYKLVCILAAAGNINIEDKDGVDVRILLVAWSPDASSTSNSAFGPVVDLIGLAAPQRRWRYAFGVESDAGEAFVKAFVAAKGHATHVHRAPPKKPNRSAARSDGSVSSNSAKRHHHVAVGGTFDHIHIGHKLLLTMTAFALDDAAGVLTIGITGDELLKNKKHAQYLESWKERQSSTHRFLQSIMDFTSPDADKPKVEEVKKSGPNGHAVNVRYGNALELRCVEISDPFGPTITEKDVSCLVLSGETRSGGQAVNDKRGEKGWSALCILEVDVLDTEGDVEPTASSQETSYQSKISSTEIRARLAQKTPKPSI